MKRFFRRIDKQFFWLLGKTFKYFLLFEFKDMMEGFRWMRVHLTHDHEKIILKDDESFEDKMNSMDEEEDVDEKDEEL